MDDYTSLVWQPLCREVAKLQISLPKREKTVIAKSAISLDRVDAQATLQATYHDAQTQNPSQLPDFARDFVTGFLRGGRDLNPRPPA